MPHTSNGLERLIEDRRARLGEAERIAERLRIEIAALEEGRTAVMGGRPARRAPASSTVIEFPRALSQTWRMVLTFVGEGGPGGRTSEAILGQSAAKDWGVQRNTLRSQLSLYVQRGLVERMAPGQFRLTEAGFRAIQPASNGEA